MGAAGWLARSDRSVPEGVEWLSSWERARLDRIRFTKRRTEYLTSRFTAKHAMAMALDLPAEPLARLEVRHRPGGAPAPYVSGEEAPLAISMTDRADWAVTLVSRDRDRRLGCDLELVEPRSDGFVADWFTTSEQELVAEASDDEDRQVRANLVWSAKESALKVLQTGLRRDTRSVVVRLHDDETDGWHRLTVAATDGPTMPGWWRRLDAFVLSVAADAPLDPPTALDAASLGIAGAVPRHPWLEQPVARDPGAR